MATTQSGSKDLRILLVEDSSEARELIRDMLTEVGYQNVFPARDGQEALDMLNGIERADSFDVVLSDWQMPGISGLELLKRIRSFSTKLPFILVTGQIGDDSIREARACGATTCLKKPFSGEELSKKIRTVERALAAGKAVLRSRDLRSR